MTKPYTGGCACGAIRYEISGEPMVSNDCQCRDCQRESGTGHGSYLSFPRAGVTVSGEAARWDMVSDSGNVKTRAFCPNCGVPVYMTFAAMPMSSPSAPPPRRSRPQMATYTVRPRLDRLDPELPKFERMPPM